MTAPLNSSVLRISHTDTADLVGKLKVILGRLGYRVENANPGRVTVGELAKLVHRNTSNVSTRLRSPHCPPYVSAKGKRRLLWIEPNDRLLSFLTNAHPGQRTDLARR